MPDISVDPDKLPRDWRKVVHTGAFLVLLTLAAGAIAAPVSLWVVDPVEKKLDAHLLQYDVLKPTMHQKVEQIDNNIEDLNFKLDILLEDCYRRGGCTRN